jgi:hypothetical protein
VDEDNERITICRTHVFGSKKGRENEGNLRNTHTVAWYASAAAVIPAQIACIQVVEVEKLVAEPWM